VSWQALVGQLSERFTLLATRVLLDGARPAHGFVLVINDQIVRGDYAAMSLRNPRRVSHHRCRRRRLRPRSSGCC
jgi:hypothetical protein